MPPPSFWLLALYPANESSTFSFHSRKSIFGFSSPLYKKMHFSCLLSRCFDLPPKAFGLNNQLFHHSRRAPIDFTYHHALGPWPKSDTEGHCLGGNEFPRGMQVAFAGHDPHYFEFIRAGIRFYELVGLSAGKCHGFLLVFDPLQIVGASPPTSGASSPANLAGRRSRRA